MTIMSGRPLDFSPDGSGLTQRLTHGSKQTPNQVGPFAVLVELGRTLSGLIPRHLRGDDAAAAGNMSRFKFTGPRFFNLDAAMFKRFR